MKVYNEISFDKDLVQNENINLKYSGKLFKDGSSEVSIVYGYDQDWKNTTEQKMEKQDDGFVTKIQLQEFDNLNFCFKNSLNEWDNNNGSDYHSTISPKIEFEINSELDKILDEILNEASSLSKENVFNENTDDINDSIDYFESIANELDSQNDSNIVSNEDYITVVDSIETLFDELFENLDEQNSNVSYAEVNEIEDKDYIFDNEPKTSQTQENLSLVETSKKKKSIFDFENLSPLYVLARRLRLAFYKLIYVLPAFLFGEEDDENN